MGTVLRDFYEVLDVERKATQDEIKVAYRKLALQWHPDKNPDRVDEATQRFKEIQNAYSVLSDPVERSWYDSHRESILRGEDAGEDADAHNDTSLNLWEYFRSSAYDDFTDSPKGFYTVYRKVFDTLDEEELSTSSKGAPRFGSSSSPWEEVARFYDYWLAFSSEKSFAWVDEYNVNVAPNRRIKRAMEKENKKERDAHRRAFNERVRQLAEYVKKRDPRVREQMLKAKQEKEEKEKRQKERRDELERDRQERLRRLHTERIAELQAEAEAGAAREHEDHDNEHHEEEEEDLNEFFCIACKKKFKSEKQWHNHEKSKKHLDNMASLRHDVMLDGEDDDEAHKHDAQAHDAAQREQELDEQELVDNSQVGDAAGPSASAAANQGQGHGKGRAANHSPSRQEDNDDDVGSQSGDESRFASPPPASQRRRKGRGSQGSGSGSRGVGKACATSGTASPGVGSTSQAPAKSRAAAKSGGVPSTNPPSSVEPESDSESESESRQDEEEEGPGPSTINDTPVSGEEREGSEADGEDGEGEEAGLEHMMAWASLHRKARGGGRGARQTAGRGRGTGKPVESESESEEDGNEEDEAPQPEVPAAGGSERETDQCTQRPSDPSHLPVSSNPTAQSVSAHPASGEPSQEEPPADLNAPDSAAVRQDHQPCPDASANGSDRSAVQKNGPKGGPKPPVKVEGKVQESKAGGPSGPPRGKAAKAADKRCGDAGEEFRCNVCRSVFATRNQLFKHINDSGHALAFAVPTASTDPKALAGSKGRRGKGASLPDEAPAAKGAGKGKKR